MRRTGQRDGSGQVTRTNHRGYCKEKVKMIERDSSMRQRETENETVRRGSVGVWNEIVRSE